MRPLKRRLVRVLQNMKLAQTFLNWWAFRAAESKRDDGETILKSRSGLNIAVQHNTWDAKIIWEQFIVRAYLPSSGTQPGDLRWWSISDRTLGTAPLFCSRVRGASGGDEPAQENFMMLAKSLGLNPHLADWVTAVNRGVAATPEIVANVQLIGREIHVSSTWYANDPAAE